MAHFDFYTVCQPQIEHAGQALLASSTANVDTVERAHVDIDDETLVVTTQVTSLTS